jgi:hypothetical protein
MPLDANAETEKADISQDGIVCVVKAFHSTKSTVYLLDNGCAIGPGTFNYLGQDYESQFGENFELQYGDVFYICCEGIDFTDPPDFNFGENGKIYYLGNAKDYCKDRMVELTLTENSPRNVFHRWSDDEGVRHCDEQCDYSEYGYVNYIDYSQFEVGDKALCALDEDGDVLAVYPIENQESTTDKHFVVENDRFLYDAYGSSFTVLDETLQPDEGEYLAVVTGVYGTDDVSYMLTELTTKFSSSTVMRAEEIAPFMDGKELHLGDVVSMKHWDTLEVYPSMYKHLTEKVDGEWKNVSDAKYVGFGTDVFGEEFLSVIRHEMANNVKHYSFLGWNSNEPFESLIVNGDATEDSDVGIIDVLAVNQALLSVRSLSAYGELAGDVNHNGTLDDGDSIKILKSLVDLETLD